MRGRLAVYRSLQARKDDRKLAGGANPRISNKNSHALEGRKTHLIGNNSTAPPGRDPVTP
jgi:hypothetical protein